MGGSPDVLGCGPSMLGGSADRQDMTTTSTAKWDIVVHPDVCTKGVGIGQFGNLLGAITPCCYTTVFYNVSTSSWCCYSCHAYATYGRIDVPHDTILVITWETSLASVRDFVEGWTGRTVAGVHVE